MTAAQTWVAEDGEKNLAHPHFPTRLAALMTSLEDSSVRAITLGYVVRACAAFSRLSMGGWTIATPIMPLPNCLCLISVQYRQLRGELNLWYSLREVGFEPPQEHGVLILPMLPLTTQNSIIRRREPEKLGRLSPCIGTKLA